MSIIKCKILQKMENEMTEAVNGLVVAESAQPKNEFAVRKSYDGGVCFGDSSCHVEKVFVRLRQEEDDELWDGIAAVRLSGINELVRDLAGKYGQKHPELQHILNRATPEDEDLKFVQNDMSKWLNESWRLHPRYRAGVAFECVVCRVKPVMYLADEDKVKVLTSDLPKAAEKILGEINHWLTENKGALPDLTPLLQLAQTNKNDDCFIFELTDVEHTGGDDWFSKSLTINVCPGEKSSVKFNLTSSGCKSIKIVLEVGGEKFVWEENQLKAQIGLLKIKEFISLGRYQKLKLFSLGRESAKVHVSLDGADCLRTYDCKTPTDNKVVQVDFDRSWFEDGNEYVLFMDMGSTRTKYITMPINGDKFDSAAFDEKENKHCVPTEVLFTGTYNNVSLRLVELLPDDFPRKEDDSGQFDLGRFKGWMREHRKEYEEFLIRAIHRFYEGQKGKIFRKVYWSFPMVGSDEVNPTEFFEEVQKRVKAGVRACILAEDSFELVAEHEALYSMYAQFTRNVASLVREKQVVIDNYNEHCPSWAWNFVPFIMGHKKLERKLDKAVIAALKAERDRQFTSEAKRIYEMFKNQGEAATDNYLLMDAGGFSTDMYCVRGGTRELDLCGSFVAGGVPLMEKFKKELVKEKKGQALGWEVDFEKLYNEWCDLGFPPCYKEKVGMALKSIYKDIIEKLQGRRPALVLLSGGVTTNEQFPEVVLKGVKKNGAILMTAKSLDAIVELYKSACDMKPWMAFFEKLVSTDNGVGSEYDIVGGMIQRACPNLFE